MRQRSLRFVAALLLMLLAASTPRAQQPREPALERVALAADAYLAHHDLVVGAKDAAGG